MRLTPLSKKILGVILIAGIVGGIYAYRNIPSVANLIPGLASDSSPAVTNNTANSANTKRTVGNDVLSVGVNTWGGFAGGISFNGGKDASQTSRYYTEFGQLVQFEIVDDFAASRDMLKNGKVDILAFTTVGEFSIEAGSLTESGIKVIAQVDKSFGGDALVVREGINSVNDLIGKTIALAPGSPSHGLLVALLSASGLTQSQVKIVEVKDGLDAADFFKKEKVDAAFVWSPDDADCINKRTGSEILFNTKKGSDIIWDCIIAEESTIRTKRPAIKALVAGWLKGNMLINTNRAYRTMAVQIMSTVYGQPEDFWSDLDIAKFVTLGDNKNFFGLNSAYKGVTGEEMYTKMGDIYSGIRYNSGEPLISGKIPAWRIVSDPSIIQELLNDPTYNSELQVAESSPKFTAPVKNVVNAQAVTTNHITVEFEFGSAQLTDAAKRIVKRDFGSIARGFKESYIRIEGNTDNIGSHESNVQLSLVRANSVKNYLVSVYEWDPKKVVVKANGPDNPVSDNDTEEGRQQNRRTDFQIVSAK